MLYRRIFGILLATIMWVCAASAWAADIPQLSIKQIADKDIASKFLYLPIHDEGLPQTKAGLEALANSAQGQPKGKNYIAVATFYNDTQQSLWYFYPYGSVVENIRLYQYQPQLTLLHQTGYNHGSQVDYHYGGNVRIAPGETVTLAAQFDSRFFFAPIKIRLAPEEQITHQLEVENLIMLLCLGVGIALSLYNLFLYMGTRQKVYLYYALTTFAFMWGWSHVFGVPEKATGSLYPQWLMSPYLLGSVFACLFVNEFLELKHGAPRLYRTLQIIAVIGIISAPLAYQNLTLGLYLASLATGANLMVGLYAGVVSWRKGYKPAKYFVFAFLAVVLPNMVGNMMNLGILPGLDINIYLLGLMGNTLDSLLLAFALAEKVRLINNKNQELTSKLESKVEQRTEALMNANATLEHLIEELKDANNAKSRFLANMSHEIRTPLTSIIGYADGMLLGDIDKQEQDRVMKIISDNGSHLLNVINDILDITKIEANKLDYEFIETPLFSMLAQIESVVGRRARDKGLLFHQNYQYPLPAVIITDPTRLKQILFNLTNNAIKFTEHGEISLTVSIDEKQLHVQVSDTGIGMDLSQQEKLFDPFAQADSSINRRFGGSGLGLSISQRLAKGLGGEIRIDSQQGKGSTFHLLVNLSTPDNCEWVNSAEEIWQVTPSRSLSLHELPTFVNARVLLADDHPSNRELAELLLKRMNIKVTAVENGQQAVDAVFYQPFDLILMDIQMPEMDGVQALRKIRSMGCQTPVIALTANNMKHEIQQYLQQGFSAHLAKPLSRKHFIEKLNEFLCKNSNEAALLDNDDMYSLIRDYATDLQEHLRRAESLWQQQDLAELQETAHRIKGSAGSFGFARLGDKFAEIERCIVKQQTDDLADKLQQSLSYGKLCVMVPGVDVAMALLNHSNDADLYINRLNSLLGFYQKPLAQLKDAITNNEPNSAIIHLHKLLPDAEKLALSNVISWCEQLMTLLKQGSIYPNECLPLVSNIQHELQKIEQFVADIKAAISNQCV